MQVGVEQRMSQSYEKFGKYLLLEKVAAGGMAEIYLSKSSAANGLNKFFAIKRILPQFSKNEDFVAMFKEEAKVCINLNHSNVVSIYDFGIELGQFYLVMDYVEGRNLRQIINELKKTNKSFSIDQALYLIKEAAAGLDHAHRCVDSTNGKPLNITHRDMSPQNVMVSFDGEVKVIDFGIAKAESENEGTKAGTLKGKFSYMSPEQAEGQSIDPRTDVFALGIVLWEILANDRLFTGSNEAAILRKVRDCQVPPIRKINPTVPQELERIVMKALAKDKNVRYQTAANFHRDLNRFLNIQYPDFSIQDFSQFIKEAFKVTYQEAREKLVKYAQISTIDYGNQLPPVDFSSTKKKTTRKIAQAAAPGAAGTPENQVDKALEKTELDEPGVAPSGFNVEKQQRITLEDIKSASTNQKNQTAFYKPNSSQTRVTQISQISYAKKNQGADTTDIFMKVAFLTLIVGGGFWWYKNIYTQTPNKTSVASTKKSNNKNEDSTEIDQSSIAEIKVSVNSSPDKAEIWLNGVSTGLKTPAILSLASGKPVEISIRKEGHIEYRVNNNYKATTQVMATLQATVAPAYLNISLKGADSFTKIAINGKELFEKLPILNYPILADRETVITAFNPITKQTDEVKINLKPGEKKEIDLVLGRSQQK